MGGRLGQPHWHPEPTELPPVGDERGVVRGGVFEGDVVESGLKVNHANPSCSS